MKKKAVNYRTLACPVCEKEGTIHLKDCKSWSSFVRTRIPHEKCYKERRRESRRKTAEKARVYARSGAHALTYLRTGTMKNRVCLSCDKKFKSLGNYNRICEACTRSQHSVSWVSGQKMLRK